jgi:Protein of unknown function (DUF2934)
MAAMAGLLDDPHSMKHKMSAKHSRSGAAAPQDQPQTLFAPPADEVALRAFLNYQNHGEENGHALTDWLRAESELIAEHHLTVTI